MEISATATVIAITAIVIAIWIWRVVNWVWLKPKRLEAFLKRQGISGTSYTFLVGDLRRELNLVNEAISKPINLNQDFVPRVAPLLSETVKNHGKISFMWVGPTPKVIIMEPEHIKEVLTKVYDFPKPTSNYFFKLLVEGVANYEGEKWSKHRRILNPIFHTEKLKVYTSKWRANTEIRSGMNQTQSNIPAFYESCREMVSKWEILVCEKNSSGEIDVWPFLVSMTADAISRSAFGSNYEESKRIFELQEEQEKRVHQALEMDLIPGWRFIPTKNNMRMKEIDREVKSTIRGIIKKRERGIREGEAPKNDVLGILLESNSREDGMSIGDVIEECRLFYLGGQESTAVLLVWTMIMLSQYQEWQARARQEVLQVFGQNKPDFDGLSHLKIISMILNEVLRLYSPGVLLDRSIDKETKLGDITLPVGVQISIPILLVHHDLDLWGDDVLEFKPERFENGISKATKNKVSFIPFGWGPRLCPGQNFTLTEAKMALTLILQKFTFELSPSYTHAPCRVFTVQPQFGAPLIFRKL